MISEINFQKIPEKYMNDSNIVFIHPETAMNDDAPLDAGARAVLERINRQIGSAGYSPHDILAFVFNESRSLFQCNRLALAFLTDGDERIKSYSVVADYEPLRLKSGYSEEIQNSSLEFVLKNRCPRIIHDLSVYLKRHPTSRSTKLMLHEGIRSSMTCPLSLDNRIVGLFFRSSIHPHIYNLNHIRFHLAIAERMSQVIEKVYRIEQLTTAMKNYDEMLGFISHEIKSPIATTIMESKLMLSDYLGELSPGVRERLERIVGRNERLLEMIRDYLDISRLEGGELRVNLTKNVDIAFLVIKPIIDIMRSDAEQKRIGIIQKLPEKKVLAEIDPDLIRIVLANLISNAIKYGNEDSEILVELESSSDGFRIIVTNEGPGFPKTEIPNLFKKYSRLQTPELIRQKGTGLGLYTVWRIVKLHRGHIYAESEQGSWARFTIDIPWTITE